MKCPKIIFVENLKIHIIHIIKIFLTIPSCKLFILPPFLRLPEILMNTFPLFSIIKLSKKIFKKQDTLVTRRKPD